MNTNTFENNLSTLMEKHASLANKMRAMVPQSITYDASNDDLIVDGERFYGQAVQTACARQVALFFRKAAHFSLKVTEKNTQKIHQNLINALSQTARDLGYRQNTKPQQGNLLLLGSGLGHHISLLEQHLNFHNIVLVEPSDEMLYHFLHHTDLARMQESLTRKGGSFYILQPGNEAEFLVQFRQILQLDLGFGFLSEVTVFRHYETPLFDHVLENFKVIRQQLLSSWGYLEDELESATHSISNSNTHRFFTRQSLAAPQQHPLVLVGNGPSLDRDIQLLKQKQHFTVVSCGTSIAPLMNAGIVPDVHAEMERSQFTANVQQKWVASDTLKDVFFLGLSTVSPAITQHFKQAILFTKANDLGNVLLNRISTESLPPLYFCNPTVTNFALSALVTMGFENIYLLGCDYGYRDIHKHHSESSDYYASSSRIGYARKDTHTVPDNFGNPILTTRIYDLARQNVEKLLAKNSHVKVTNCSDGAAIKHTQYQEFSAALASETSLADSTVSQNNSLKNYLRSLGKRCVLDNSVMKPSRAVMELETYQAVMSGLKTLLQSKTQPENFLAALKTLLITTEKQFLNDQAHVLFIGDLRYYHLLFSGHLYRLKSTDLSRYLQLAMAQIEKAIWAYQELLINLDNGDNS